jgi:hypothetical protein
MKKKAAQRLYIDGVFFLTSIVCAIVIAQLSVVTILIDFSGSFKLLPIFLAGMAFTSVFTITPAAVILAKLSLIQPLWLVSLLGALGAVCTDIIIFSFFKQRISEDLNTVIKSSRWLRPILIIQKARTFRWVSLVVGAFIIASPLPDELGLAIMGITKVSFRIFIPLAFVLNTLGILALGLLAQNL